MRLLHTRTLQFDWVEDPLSVDYAILSHVWSRTRAEQSYHEVMTIIHRSQGLESTNIPHEISEKIRRACACALDDGYEYLWIDSCCIDKSSSAELSEAINSMYQWYGCASQCYAYLYDVDDADDPRRHRSQFRESEWFRRGWTLQELIAPPSVVFLTKNWRPIGTKHSLANVVEEVTGIDKGILKGTETLEVVSVARRMSWAARRTTTRIEDQAYSLMGLFNINMPAIYGEGRSAFVRLQKQILKHYPDDTLLGWGDAFPLTQLEDLELLTHIRNPPDYHGRIFAESPKNFEFSKDLWPINQEELMTRLEMHEEAARPPPTFSITRYGVQAELPVLSFRGTSSVALTHLRLAFLMCEDVTGDLVALILRPASVYGEEQASRPAPKDLCLLGCRVPMDDGSMDNYRLVKIGGKFLQRLMRIGSLSLSLTHLLRGGPPAVRLNPRWNSETHPRVHPGKCSVLMPSWRTTALAARGIKVQKLVMDRPQTSTSSWCLRRHVFILAFRTGAMRIVVGFCEHCTPADVLGRPDSRTGSLRVQVQSCVSQRIPPTTPASLCFCEHDSSEHDPDHVSRWPVRNGVASMEFTLRRFEAFEYLMRVSIALPESPRDLVLTLDVEFKVLQAGVDGLSSLQSGFATLMEESVPEPRLDKGKQRWRYSLEARHAENEDGEGGEIGPGEISASGQVDGNEKTKPIAAKTS